MVLDSELSTKQRHKLSDEDFAVPAREGLPIPDEEHVTAAMSRFNQYEFADSGEKRSAFHRIVKRARSLGIDPSGFEKEWSARLDAAPRRGNPMDEEKLKETIRSLNAQLEEMRKELQSTQTRADSETTRADTNQGRIDAMQKRIDDLDLKIRTGASAVESEAVTRERARADSLQSKVDQFDKTIETKVRDRAKLERQAATVMGDDFRMDDLNDRQVREAVVRRLDSSADVSASVSDGVVTGRFLTLVEGHAQNARSQARVAEIIVDAGRTDSEEKPQRRASEKDKWKQPLPNDIRAKRSGKDA
jgi:gas vesicle protein